MMENSASDSLLQSNFLKVESQTWRRLAIGGAVLIAYFLTAKIGLRFATVNPSATAIWAPSGISVAACILCGSWIWPAVFAGAFLANATTYGSLATTLAIAAGNTGEALIGAHLVRRFAGAEKAFDRTDDTFRFVILAAISSTIFSATVGVTSLCLDGYASWSKYVLIWFTWWLGDATGDLIIAPLLILWTNDPRFDYGRQKAFEAALLIGTLLVAGLVFGGFLSIWAPALPHVFVCTPILLWAAFRFGRRETITAAFILSIIAIMNTVSGSGPSSHRDKNEDLLLMQAFVAVIGISFLTVSVEVEERNRLDQSRWLLAAIVRSSDDAIIAITPRGQITSWNAAAERMYGFSAAEAIGKPITIIIPPDQASDAAEALARINQDETIAPFETVRLHKNGTRVDVSLSMSPVKDDDGCIIGASKIARDITQLTRVRQEREALLKSEREAREEAERANRAKDEFLAMLGHELRNPLHVISLASQLLAKPKSLEQARSIIARQTAHVSRLVDDLLDAARVTSGRIILMRRPINLAELVEECISSLRETRQLDRHILETELDTVWVDADPDRLAQIVTNLVGNAVKYTPAGGKIRVSVMAREHAIIQVQDNGSGITPELLPHVFDLFARGELGLHRSPGGLGIGLTLVKQIAELHGGHATAASDGPGRGSTFTVELPCIAAPETSSSQLKGKPKDSVRPCRILLIEDNDDARATLRDLLEASGHELYEAGDGPGGVEKAFAIKPDVALVDLGLPGFDGYETASRIRSAPECTHVVLIALTGYGQDEYRRKGDLAGFHGYLVKPVDVDELEKVIATVGADRLNEYNSNRAS
jgi:PAS domain S-box-containing protein